MSRHRMSPGLERAPQPGAAAAEAAITEAVFLAAVEAEQDERPWRALAEATRARLRTRMDAYSGAAAMGRIAGRFW